jgi:hypothetical protein
MPRPNDALFLRIHSSQGLGGLGRQRCRPRHCSSQRKRDRVITFLLPSCFLKLSGFRLNPRLREVYFPWLDEASVVGPPGRMVLVAVAADEPAGKSISQCAKQTVSLLVHRGTEDDRLLQSEGPTAFRRQRLPDLCQEALSQGALLTREDLAYRIFFVSPRTISRDLAWLRGQDPAPPLPLRSLVHDIGPVLTHRVQVVRLALQGKTTTEICRILRHSPAAVANYLSTFTRCAQLAQRQLHFSQIAFLLRRGRALIRQYLDLLAECQRDPTMAYHLEQQLQLAQVGGEKKSARRNVHAR